MNGHHKVRVRIGAGAGFAGDRIEPAVEVAAHGGIDFLVFECLAERTIALAQLEKLSAPQRGFDPKLVQRMEAVLPHCARKHIRIITNSGAANPRGGARAIVETARRLGIRKLKVAAVIGDDVLDSVLSNEAQHAARYPELRAVRDRVISANAYVGAAPIVEALDNGADVIITGRVADPSLFLAPLIHSFRWSAENWELMGRGILVGHLLECAGQLTGGYFADPPRRVVPDLARLGFPIAEVTSEGEATFSKVAGTGGVLNVATCTEQLLYEVHDPARYVTPDVVADFSAVAFQQLAPDSIRATGASGSARPEDLKVTVAYRDGYLGEGQLTYAGSSAPSRAQLALDTVVERLKLIGLGAIDLRTEIIGVNSVMKTDLPRGNPCEVRIRVVGRTETRQQAEAIGDEVEALYTNGPAGGGGAYKAVREVVGVLSMLLPREAVQTSIEYEET